MCKCYLLQGLLYMCAGACACMCVCGSVGVHVVVCVYAVCGGEYCVGVGVSYVCDGIVCVCVCSWDYIVGVCV